LSGARIRVGALTGERQDEALVRRVYSRSEGGAHWSAIQITTASPICAARSGA
jgi:hypothetical protein